MKFYVTTPIYYVNAKPHVGSAYTTIAADVVARWHKQQGGDVRFITGTAEHGDKIAQSAEAASQTVQEFADGNAEQFTTAWTALNSTHDDFIRTSEDRHAESVAHFFNRLKASGHIYEGEYQGLYCVGHEAFIKESELNEAGECPDHGTTPETLQEKNWFFKLSEYGDVLREKITNGEFIVAPEKRKNEVLAFIDQGLEDIAISRQSVANALPLPWDETQTIYVWLDELWSYYTASNGNWPADVHLVGKDIIKFHCIIWPALLLAIGEELPKKVFAHGFFTVNGQKISKSLGNAIDPVELAQEWGADTVRYYLLRDIPFGNDGDFSHERLKERYNADLANGLGNLVSRTLNMIEQYTPDLIRPEATAELGEVSSEVQQFITQANQHTEELAFDKALASIWQAIAWADALIEETKPWELAKKDSPPDKGELEGVLAQLYQILVAVNEALAPYLPETHQKLSALLTARPLKKPAEPLFARR